MHAPESEISGRTHRARWPTVGPEDWCGTFQYRSNYATRPDYVTEPPEEKANDQEESQD